MHRKPAPDDFKMTAEESELIEAYGLDAEQIFWRRSKTRRSADPSITSNANTR
jgi:hypothetical protein